MSADDVLGAHRGGTYTRSYLVMFWVMAMAGLVLDGVLRGTVTPVGLTVLVVLGSIGVVLLLGVAQSVLTRDELRLVLLRRRVPWVDVAEVLEPEAGDTEVRLRTWDGTVVTAKGVPVSARTGVAELVAASRR